jgi:hypothetical protein
VRDQLPRGVEIEISKSYPNLRRRQIPKGGNLRVGPKRLRLQTDQAAFEILHYAGKDDCDDA